MPLTIRAGFVPGPSAMFYEQLTPADADPTPLVLVHGGGFTGASYLSTPDGRPGWAFDFIRHGYRVVLPDWPGVGRSSAVPDTLVDGEVVAKALGELLEFLGRPAVLLVHSMSAPYGYRVLETHGELVQSMVAVAPAPPGNLQPAATVQRETPTEIEVTTPEINLTLPRHGSWLPTPEFIRRKLVGDSTRFDPAALPGLQAQTAPIPARLLMERVNLHGSQLRVEQRRPYAGTPVLVVTGAADTGHPREADLATVEWLRSLGAHAHHYFLGDRGVPGNGHLPMSETNSGLIADVIAGWLTSRKLDAGDASPSGRHRRWIMG
jgi:pimeloyl-ACP methyl ester carboxylesterase